MYFCYGKMKHKPASAGMYMTLYTRKRKRAREGGREELVGEVGLVPSQVFV